MDRRHFLTQTLLGTCALPLTSYALNTEIDAYPFVHGVASGDATDTAIIIWTRITKPDLITITGMWQIATDIYFEEILHSNVFETNDAQDFTVKIDVNMLQPNTHYFYRFIVGGEFSPIGKCRTLPLNLNVPLTIAAVSCNNYEDGYFSLFKHIADNSNIDYVFHLGDYIYEYGTGTYANKPFIKKEGRINVPKHELKTLADYRQRLAHYRKDPQLQKLHQEKTMFCMWDDHEFANDAYMDGAKNHKPTQKGWEARKNAAIQAYFEWLPVRASSIQEMIRDIRIGDDCHFYLLEERFDGRVEQLSVNDKHFNDADRTMISPQQLDWLATHLQDESVRWHMVINQVMFTGYRASTQSSDKKLDWWTGYPVQRQQLMSIFETMKNPPILITADHHRAFALEIVESDSPTQGKVLGYEFLATSITSKNDDRLTKEKQRAKRKRIYDLNPHVLYNNTYDHGYLIITMKKESVEVDYRYSENILKSDAKERQGPIFRVNQKNHLIRIG